MKKFMSILLCFILCFNLMPVITIAIDNNPGALEGLDIISSGDYIINQDLSVTSADSISLSGGTVTVNDGVTLTIAVGARVELRGTEFTNNGTIIIEADSEGEPPEDGRLEIWNDGGSLVNKGQLTINGGAEFVVGAELLNVGTGTVIVNGLLRLYDGAKITNSGTFTGGDNGRINLQNPSEENNDPFQITDLYFYENASDEEETTDLSGEFRYDGVSSKWIRSVDDPGPGGGDPGTQYSITLDYDDGKGSIRLNEAYEVGGEYYFNENETVHVTIEAQEGFSIEDVVIDGVSEGAIESYYFENLAANHTVSVTFSEEPIGGGSLHTITVVPSVNGDVSAEGLVDGQVEVEDGNDITFTVTPDSGYRISEVIVNGFEDDWSWNLNYIGSGNFEFPLMEVRSDMTIEFIFSGPDLVILAESNFVILEEETESDFDIQSSLANQFGSYGYALSEEDFDIMNEFIDEIDSTGYGTFTFKVSFGTEWSDEMTGYIVKAANDIIFKLDDGNGTVVIEIVSPSLDPNIDELAVPAMHTGTMEVFGYGNLVAAPMTDMEMDDGKFILPFYRGQLHIFNFMPGDGNVNLYGFYVIQEDALCVRVDAKSGGSEQKTNQWDFNRYTNLTNGNDTSYVFFGNDEFVLSIPPEDIGAAVDLEIEIGEFTGYIVEENEDGTYSVNFLSDFYDNITVNLTINGTEDRQLNIRRVGVDIGAYMWEEDIPPPNAVSHGTQNGTRIDFSGEDKYKIYGTYCIPDNGDEAPYGLYVIYTWANGSKTTAIITDPCNDPDPMAEDFFSEGVFHYDNHADTCDYLLYSGQNKAQAPVKINVTVLKGDPAESGSFEGIFFGSGAGVEWTKD